MVTAIWGDGFVDDGFATVTSPRDWATVDSDELIRFFPRLRAEPGFFPRGLVDHLDRSIDARRGTLDVVARPFVMRLFSSTRFGSTAGQHDAGTDCHSAPDDSVRFLEVLQAALRRGSAPAFDEPHATRLAFHGAIHPAYIWPEAAPLSEKFMCAGWLGIVARGRAALIPLDVADYLADTLHLQEDGRVILRDADLAGIVEGLVDLSALSRAVACRRTDPRVIMRCRRSTNSRWGRADRAAHQIRIRGEPLADGTIAAPAASGGL